MTNKNVLVTGASGFVGRTLCSHLLQAGYNPRAGIRCATHRSEVSASIPGVREYVTIGDLGEGSDLSEAVENVGTIVHLAGRVHQVRRRVDKEDSIVEYRRVNVQGTRAIAHAALEHGVRRIVFVSSAKVNGEWTLEHPVSEEDQPDPQGSYAQSKWEAEQVLRSVADQGDLEIVIVRPPLVYGPRVRANFLRLMRLVEQERFLPIPNCGNQRSLVGVSNLADFLTVCVFHERAANETFLVSDCEDVSTRELAIRLARALGRSARFVPLPERVFRFAASIFGKQSEADRLYHSFRIDSSKARQVLGWQPSMRLDTGLAVTARWYLECLGESRRMRGCGIS